MAKYVVTPSETDDWGEDMPGTKRFSYLSEAEEYFQHEEGMGRFVRLIVWDNGIAKERRRSVAAQIGPPPPTHS